VHALTTVALGATLALLESVPGVGIAMPGEVAITGLAAASDPAVTVALVPAVMAGACLGDQIGYWSGRRLGDRLPASRIGRRIPVAAWRRATTSVERHGAGAVVTSRLLPFVRTVMPAVAGVAGMTPLRFTLASVVGSALWSLLWIVCGSAAAAAMAGVSAVAPVAVVALAVAVTLWWRRGHAAVPRPR
jgi:membrane protein DedA with SNARE-associated domain